MKKIKLCLTDADSLFNETDDVYENLFQDKEDKELFDNSNYPNNSAFYFYENKKLIGKI